MSCESLHDQGVKTFAGLVPDGEARLAEIFRAAPALGELAVGTVYGYLHHRTGLDPRIREAVALAAIVASGTVGAPLAVHLRTALAAGLARAEIREIVLQTAAFSGFPRAVSALPAMERAFEEAGAAAASGRSPREIVLEALSQLHPNGSLAPEGRPPLTDWSAGRHAAVHTIARDQAVVVFAPRDAPECPESALLVRIEDDRIADATWLTGVGEPGDGHR